VGKITTDLDHSAFHDGYGGRIEALIKPKLKGKVTQVLEKRPKKPAAKSMMEAMRATAKSLK
jgi:non-homologous end joining protein Ku